MLHLTRALERFLLEAHLFMQAGCLRTAVLFECFSGQRVNLTSGVTRAKTVVNIYNRYSASATVEHPEQCGDTPEARAVTNAGRHGNERPPNEPGDDTRKGSFHTRDDN